MLIRQGVTIIPGWQIAVSAIILVVCAAGAIWLAGRAFRLGMLRYGKRLAWREIFTRRGARA
jgi:ABC-2 type transport system permease protein